MVKFLALITGILFLAIPTPVRCQVAPCKVYSIKQEDGSVLIMGENHGFLPYSVALDATLVLMRSTVALPARIALPPTTEPQVLAVFTPEQAGCSYRYKTFVDLGIYTGQVPDSNTVYHLPFKASADTIRPRQKFRNQYVFALPPGTPILAAREGTVAYIRQTQKATRQRKKGNVILIYHPDGTYGSYENVVQSDSIVQIGQQIKQGSLIGYSFDNKYEPNFWFMVVYLTKTTIAPAPVTFADNHYRGTPR
ncbi:M23 family metallopeptidase [Hymenobacter rigui]|uniref:M23 family metallopeptidase n=1 Tax=Hymenobacter rigui TaxID=334424 RepID=A0A428KTH5_9BACT|nr:M23 family metallopeptidase [Hymenobacter rigui]RSK49919.1 M23 family metallopeptidase [Hymenobacter rigui]